jgi:hypothetical protein
MAPKKTTLKEIGEMLAFVVKHMATKDDIARLDKKIDSVESNLAGKINRLDTKLTKFEEHEIDKRKQTSPQSKNTSASTRKSPPDLNLGITTDVNDGEHRANQPGRAAKQRPPTRPRSLTLPHSSKIRHTIPVAAPPRRDRLNEPPYPGGFT